ncbi:glycosyltransferase family 2 protein [Vibrio sp.]|nr:glycosyltransferase family 2 protein [Vibrio sp.]
MSNMPFFSIVVATCNRPDLAFRAVSELLNQDYKNKEIIVVNNGSSKECNQQYNYLFKDVFSLIKYINVSDITNVGLGPSVARNIGISASQGDYITFCDDDDLWSDQSYLSCISKYLRLNETDVVFANQRALDSNNHIQKNSWFDISDLVVNCVKFDTDDFYKVNAKTFYDNGIFPHLNITIYNKKLIENYGGFDQNLSYEEDLEIFYRLSSHAKDIIFYNKVVSDHFIPNVDRRTNLTTSVNYKFKMLSRIFIANKILLNSNDQSLTTFSTRHGYYSLQSLSDFFFKEKDFKRSSLYLSQSFGWGSKFKVVIKLIYNKLNTIFKGKS